MAAPLNKQIALTHFENTGWQRQPGGGELFTLTAHFSNGKTETRTAAMMYAKGEREGIMERAFAPKKNPTRQEQYQLRADLARVTAIRERRQAMQQALYAELQGRYGNGVRDQFHDAT